MTKTVKKSFDIPRKIFRDLVKEINNECNPDIYWYNDAYDALQTDTEEFIIEKFRKAQDMTKLTKNKTIQKRHFITNIHDTNTHLVREQDLPWTDRN